MRMSGQRNECNKYKSILLPNLIFIFCCFSIRFFPFWSLTHDTECRWMGYLTFISMRLCANASPPFAAPTCPHRMNWMFCFAELRQLKASCWRSNHHTHTNFWIKYFANGIRVHGNSVCAEKKLATATAPTHTPTVSTSVHMRHHFAKPKSVCVFFVCEFNGCWNRNVEIRATNHRTTTTTKMPERETEFEFTYLNEALSAGVKK